MSYLAFISAAASAETILANAEIVANAYRVTVPIHIPCKELCRALRPHPDFAPLAETECELDDRFRPHAPGLLGYLKGIPVYYKPVR